MPWFKVDDALAFNMKAIGAGNAALGLWVRAGSWSMQQLSDGFIPDPIVFALGGDDVASTALVASGLWERATSGFQFHDWADYQPTKEQILAERAAAAERKRKSREAYRARSQSESRRDAYGMDAVIPGGSPASPTRPDPTQPSPTQPVPINGSGEGAADATLSPFCSKHPQGTEKPCRACGTARMAYELAVAAEKSKPTPIPMRTPECDQHPGYPLPCDKCARIAAEEVA